MTLLEWIELQPFEYTKVNVRPWGSYELQITIDGRPAHLANPYGWGWKEKDAFEDILTFIMKDVSFHSNLTAWLGEERFNQIVTILAESPIPVELPVEIPNETKLLEEPTTDDNLPA